MGRLWVGPPFEVAAEVAAETKSSVTRWLPTRSANGRRVRARPAVAERIGARNGTGGAVLREIMRFGTHFWRAGCGWVSENRLGKMNTGERQREDEEGGRHDVRDGQPFAVLDDYGQRSAMLTRRAAEDLRSRIAAGVGHEQQPGVRARRAASCPRGSGWRTGHGLGRTLHVGRRAAPAALCVASRRRGFVRQTFRQLVSRIASRDDRDQPSEIRRETPQMRYRSSLQQ